MERKTRDMKSPLFFYVYKKKVDVKLRGEISSVSLLLFGWCGGKEIQGFLRIKQGIQRTFGT